MSAALFDLALRVAARERGAPVPRLLHSPAPARDVAVAVSARRVGKRVTVTVVGPDGQVRTGTGSDGLAVLARASGCADGDLGGGATALVDTPATMGALAGLASAYAEPARCGEVDVLAGSALAGWWVERAAHPGTSAVTDVLALTRHRFMLGTDPASETPQSWRQALGVPGGVRGLHQWQRAVAGGPLLPGLDAIRDDDDWLLGVHQDALTDCRSWDRAETLHLAAARLASRCDAADVYAAALLGDPLWRARSVHTGFVLHGEAVVGAATGDRVMVRAARLDTRLKPGAEVVGWPGDPMTAIPERENRFTGEVFATSVHEGELTVTIGGLRRGYRPAAGETLTVIPAPPSTSTIRSRRLAVARLYRRRFSWLSQGAAPTAARRGVPLALLVAAADTND